MNLTKEEWKLILEALRTAGHRCAVKVALAGAREKTKRYASNSPALRAKYKAEGELFDGLYDRIDQYLNHE